MSTPNNKLVGIGIAIVLLIGSFAAVLLYLNFNANHLDIHFIPDSISSSPGETAWFLVEIDTTAHAEEPDVDIQANMSIDADYTYWPETPLLEVFLYPNSSHSDLCIEVEVTLTLGELISKDTAVLKVLNWTFDGLSEVIGKRDVFIDYLSANHPELGINESTDWVPIHNGAGILIVGHYLFKSAQWEMEVAWHVMIAPHDWVQVYLRQRADLQPSWAGQIESWSTNNDTIAEMNPPAQIYRPMASA